METAGIRLGKAEFRDWESMYRNIWSQPEAAAYMQWKLYRRFPSTVTVIDLSISL